MMTDKNNYAFIDAQNVYMGTRGDGWIVDLFRLRRYLKERFGVSKAFWFAGYLPEQEAFYAVLRNAGFIAVFKEVARDQDGAPKGNVDVDLTLHAVDLKGQYTARLYSPATATLPALSATCVSATNSASC